MTLDQAVNLINKKTDCFEDTHRWADLGCGTGLFTQALAQLLPVGSMINAVDTNQAALQQLPKLEAIEIVPHLLNFKKDPWPFRDLDGVLMANSLHYVSNKHNFIRQIQSYLKQNHQFLIVEYERSWPNPWVPYPISYKKLSTLFQKLGYAEIIRLGERPSVYGNGQIYAALIRR